MSKELIFSVKGSSDDPYTVTFKKNDDTTLLAYCTCRAGENGLPCKHRFSILEGDGKAIVSENIDDLKIVSDWLLGTETEKLLNHMASLAAEEVRIKKALKRAKGDLANSWRR